MRCFLCRHPDLVPLPFDLPEYVELPTSTHRYYTGEWMRCPKCGSDTNNVEYSRKNYTTDLAVKHAENGGGEDSQERHCTTNVEWFDPHIPSLPNRDFLDVGCCDGAVLRFMQRKGWAVHGFDVFPPPFMGPHITVAPVFSRWLFPRQYSAVICREVIEHVPYPEMLIAELKGACLPGGIVQIQTPAPLDTFNVLHVYQEPHLFIASREKLLAMVEDVGFQVIDKLYWDGGQALMCRA